MWAPPHVSFAIHVCLHERLPIQGSSITAESTITPRNLTDSDSELGRLRRHRNLVITNSIVGPISSPLLPMLHCFPQMQMTLYSPLDGAPFQEQLRASVARCGLLQYVHHHYVAYDIGWSPNQCRTTRT